MKLMKNNAKRIFSILLMVMLLGSTISPALLTEAGSGTENTLTNITFETFDGSTLESALPAGVTSMTAVNSIKAAPGSGHGSYSLYHAFEAASNKALQIDYPMLANHTYEIGISYYFEAGDTSNGYVPWFNFLTDTNVSMCGGIYDASHYGSWVTTKISYTPTANMSHFTLRAQQVNAYFDDITIKDTTVVEIPYDGTSDVILATDFSDIDSVEVKPFAAGANASVEYKQDSEKGTIAVCTIKPGIQKDNMVYIPYSLEAGTTYAITMTFKSPNWFTWCYTGSTSSNIGSAAPGAATAWTTVTHKVTVENNKAGTYLGFGIPTNIAQTAISISSIQVKKLEANSADCQIYDFDANNLAGVGATAILPNAYGVENKVGKLTDDNNTSARGADSFDDTTLTYELTAGETYKLSFDYKGAGTLRMLGYKTWPDYQEISRLTPNSAVEGQLNDWIAIKSDTWQTFELEFEASANHKTLSLDASYQEFAAEYGITAGSTLYFDNVCIKKSGSMPLDAGADADINYVTDDEKGTVAVCDIGAGINASKMVYITKELEANKTYEVTMTYKSNKWTTWCYTANNTNISNGGCDAKDTWTTTTWKLTVPEDLDGTRFGLGTNAANTGTQVIISSIRINECVENSADYQKYDFDATTLSGVGVVAIQPDADGVENRVGQLTDDNNTSGRGADSYDDASFEYELTAGETYKLSFDYKGAGTLKIHGWPSGNWGAAQTISINDPVTAVEGNVNGWVALKGNTWQSYAVEFVASANHKMLSLDVSYQDFASAYGIAAGSTLYFDNVVIEKVEAGGGSGSEEDDSIIMNNKSALTFETYSVADNNNGLPAGVTALNGATVTKAPKTGHGNYSLKNSYHESNDGILKVDLPLEADHTYEITVNYYFEPNTSAHSTYSPWFSMYAYSGETVLEEIGNHYDATYGSWKSNVFTYTPAEDVSSFTLIANKVNGYFDDINIIDKTSPEKALYLNTDFEDVQTVDWLPIRANANASIKYKQDADKGIIAECQLAQGISTANMIYFPFALKANTNYDLIVEYKSTAWSCLYFDEAPKTGLSFAENDTWTTVTHKFTAEGGEQYLQIGSTLPNAVFSIASIVLSENNNSADYQLYDFDAITLKGTKNIETTSGVDGTNSKATVLTYPETGRDYFDSTLEYALEKEDIYKLSFDYKGSGVLQLISYVKWGEGNQVLSNSLEGDLTADGVVRAGDFIGLSSTDWGTCEIVFQAGADHKMLTMSSAYQTSEAFKDFIAGSKLYIDNICIERVMRAEDIVLLQPDEDLEKITFTRFGIENGKYSTTKNEIAVDGKSRYSLDGTLLCGKMLISGPGVVFTVGGLDSPWHGMRFESRDNGNIYLYWIGTENEGPLAIFDSEKAKSELIGEMFDLKMSTQLIDADGDGEKDDIKLGVWFNDLLYRNQYITILNRGAELGTRLSIACNNAGPYMIIESIPELVEGFDFAFFGLDENWRKTLLETGLKTDLATGGSKDATPYSGDMTNIFILMAACVMFGGIASGTYVIRKRKDS